MNRRKHSLFVAACVGRGSVGRVRRTAGKGPALLPVLVLAPALALVLAPATNAAAPDARGQAVVTAPDGGRYGPMTPSDALWSIANRLRPDNSVTVQQMMLALVRANPQAFVGSNINNLKKGAVLRLPDAAEMRALSAQEAVLEVAAQNNAWRIAQGYAPVPATAQDAAVPAIAQDAAAAAQGYVLTPATAPDAPAAAAATNGIAAGAVPRPANAADRRITEVTVAVAPKATAGFAESPHAAPGASRQPQRQVETASHKVVAAAPAPEPQSDLLERGRAVFQRLAAWFMEDAAPWFAEVATPWLKDRQGQLAGVLGSIAALAVLCLLPGIRQRPGAPAGQEFIDVGPADVPTAAAAADEPFEAPRIDDSAAVRPDDPEAPRIDDPETPRPGDSAAPRIGATGAVRPSDSEAPRSGASAAAHPDGPETPRPGDPEVPQEEEDSHEEEADNLVENKLELARAYFELGDTENVRELLQEVLDEGDGDQQERARQLLAQV